jgi:hypothetical protein
MIPFVHSNNKNAHDLLHMRPDYPKTYPKSTLGMLNQKDVQNNFMHMNERSKFRRQPVSMNYLQGAHFPGQSKIGGIKDLDSVISSRMSQSRITLDRERDRI